MRLLYWLLKENKLPRKPRKSGKVSEPREFEGPRRPWREPICGPEKQLWPFKYIVVRRVKEVEHFSTGFVKISREYGLVFVYVRVCV